MSFAVLGPFEVRVEGREVAPPGKVARRMLAALLLSADQPVDDDQLAAWTWGPQRVSRGALHTAAYRLRSWLADQAEPVVSLVHGAAGYRLDLPAEYVDAGRFRLLTRRRPDRSATDQISDLEEALALWRGLVLADLPEWTREHPEVAALERERVAALSSLADAIAASGRSPSESTLGQVEQLAAEMLYDETVQARWLLLLAAAGRRAEALRHYDDVRRRLADDLGVDPSAVLRDAHLTLLADDEAPAAAPASPASVPRMLPRGVADFSGRADEVERLMEAATADRSERIVVIDGMAGVGKTTFAVHAAHRLTPEFPDGQIFLDLQGFAESARPVEPAAALDRMLRSLGVASEQIPTDVDDRAALWRSLLAERRMLVLLDNAVSEAQLRPLLPATSECLVLITSRRRLSGLEDILPVSLDAPSMAEAAKLFREIVGPARIGGQPVDDVVELCGRLPLAVRIAAARMRDRPSWRLDDLERRLSDQAERLAELEVGDRSVATAFRLSYEQLDNPERALFRRLGLHSGPDIDVPAAAALAELPVRTARRLLDRLVDMHLLEQPAADRYHFHDLLGSFAAELARDEDADDVRRAAVERLLSHYASRAVAAIDILDPGEASTGGQPAESSAFVDRQGAVAWLTAEHRNLIAVASLAERNGFATHAITLSESLHRYLTAARHFDDVLTLHSCALRAARQSKDLLAEARVLSRMAGSRHQRGDHQAAAELSDRSVSLFRAAGDRVGEYDALRMSAAIKLFMGEFASGREQLERALSLDLGAESVPVNSRARVLKQLAHYSNELGEYDAALQYAQESLNVATELGPRMRGWAWSMLGGVLRSLGRDDESIEAYHNALVCFHDAGDVGGPSLATNNIGRSLRALGRLDEALSHHREALAIAVEIADGNAQLEAHRELAITLRASGRPAKAMPHLDRALELAGELDQHADAGYVHEELARARLACGDTEQARRHWQQALVIMTECGLPAAERVRDDLAALDRDDA